MAELKVILKNESNETTGQNATSTSEQQQIVNAKKQAQTERAKTIGKVGSVAMSVANSSVGLYSQYSNAQASFEGNSAYSQRVAFNNSMLQKGVSMGGSFAFGTLLTGNISFGGVAMLINGATEVASLVIDARNTGVSNSIARQSQVIASQRLGSADNFWRK